MQSSTDIVVFAFNAFTTLPVNDKFIGHSIVERHLQCTDTSLCLQVIFRLSSLHETFPSGCANDSLCIDRVVLCISILLSPLPLQGNVILKYFCVMETCH